MSFFKVASPGPAAEGRCGDPDGRWRPPTLPHSLRSRRLDQHRGVGSSIPEKRQELPFIPPTLCGALARIWGFCQGLDRTDKNFACTYENWCSDGLKLVEVKLQHKSLYNGLESEHWWVLSNSFITCPHWSFFPSISPVPVLWPASSALDPSER
ncbi:hypothetical protein AOLI_G00170330 [Acnodon oligacanthus]